MCGERREITAQYDIVDFKPKQQICEQESSSVVCLGR